MSETNWSVYPRVEEVILTILSRGAGKDFSDPVRTVVQVHHKDGEFIAEFDPVMNMEKLNGRLHRAEELLRQALQNQAGNARAELYARIEDFFDPEPLG